MLVASMYPKYVVPRPRRRSPPGSQHTHIAMIHSTTKKPHKMTDLSTHISPAFFFDREKNWHGAFLPWPGLRTHLLTFGYSQVSRISNHFDSPSLPPCPGMPPFHGIDGRVTARP